MKPYGCVDFHPKYCVVGIGYRDCNVGRVFKVHPLGLIRIMDMQIMKCGKKVFLYQALYSGTTGYLDIHVLEAMKNGTVVEIW